MKKNAFLLVVISVILCFSVCLVSCSDHSRNTKEHKVSKTTYHYSSIEEEDAYLDGYLDSYLEDLDPDRGMNADYGGRGCY